MWSENSTNLLPLTSCFSPLTSLITMNVTEILKQDNSGKQRFSFEVLPPLKGSGTAALFNTIDLLKDYNPLFINITTHHSEYVYKELENGQFERQRIRRRPGTIAMAAPSRTATVSPSSHISSAAASRPRILSMN